MGGAVTRWIRSAIQNHPLSGIVFVALFAVLATGLLMTTAQQISRQNSNAAVPSEIIEVPAKAPPQLEQAADGPEEAVAHPEVPMVVPQVADQGPPNAELVPAIPLRQPNENIALAAQEIFNKVNRAVVFIEACDSKQQHLGFGTGFFLDEKGLVVTNKHVVWGADHLRVRTLNGDARNIYDVARSDDRDIATFVFPGPVSAHLKLQFKEPSIGQPAYALGHSLGFERTFSEGIVSSVRTFPEYHQAPGKWIQITAPTSGGNSGGPIVNSNGDAIGMLTWGANRGENLNFALSVDEISQFLSKNTKPERLADSRTLISSAVGILSKQEALKRLAAVQIQVSDLLEASRNDKLNEQKLEQYLTSQIKRTPIKVGPDKAQRFANLVLSVWTLPIEGSENSLFCVQLILNDYVHLKDVGRADLALASIWEANKTFGHSPQDRLLDSINDAIDRQVEQFVKDWKQGNGKSTD